MGLKYLYFNFLLKHWKRRDKPAISQLALSAHDDYDRSQEPETQIRFPHGQQRHLLLSGLHGWKDRTRNKTKHPDVVHRLLSLQAKNACFQSFQIHLKETLHLLTGSLPKWLQELEQSQAKPELGTHTGLLRPRVNHHLTPPRVHTAEHLNLGMEAGLWI